MSSLVSKPRRSFHYAWVVAGITFLILLATAGVRSTPGVLIVPLEKEFGWSRATISLAVSVNLVLYGLIGPFAAALMGRLGIRKTVLISLVVVAGGVALTTADDSPLATHPALGRGRRGRDRDDGPGAGRDGRQSLVRRAARAGPRRPDGEHGDGPVGLPPAAGVDRDAVRLAPGRPAGRRRGGAGHSPRGALPARAAVGRGPAPVRRSLRGRRGGDGSRATRSWPPSRPCATGSVRATSGSWPGASSSAAPAPTA